MEKKKHENHANTDNIEPETVASACEKQGEKPADERIRELEEVLAVKEHDGSFWRWFDCHSAGPKKGITHRRAFARSGG